MTDHDAFMQAIIADPANDTPRLLYADWLEEQGDGERAEFIRMQCELANHPTHHKAETGCPLRKRERELLAGGIKDVPGHMLAMPRPEWVCPGIKMLTMAPQCGDCRWTFTRGFVSEIRMPIEFWMDGKCPQCHGEGYWEPAYLSDQAGRKCDACLGTGTIPGIGPAIVAAQPLERVVVTDKRPEMTGAYWGWYSVGNRLTPEGTIIPVPLFNLLKQYSITSGSSQIVHFFTEQAAQDALSRAAIAWARQQATLPANC